MAETTSKEELVTLIKQKRAQLEDFLQATRPRKRRLLNTTIIGGSLAAILTAAPALGGESFTHWLSGAFSLASPSWRILCAIASICSVSATIATQFLKSYNIEEHVARAQGCRAKLEVLEASLSLGQVNAQQATAEYLKCVEDAGFIESV